MDINYENTWKIKLENLANKLRENGFEAFCVSSKEDLSTLLDSLMKPGSLVNAGGSMTLQETGIIDYLRKGPYTFFDRTDPSVNTPEKMHALNRQAFSADYYFASANAITSEGEIYNVDGRGNRVAATIYGPDKVILVVGRNKWVRDLDEAISRNREISAPANCVRLSRKTPCAVTGSCGDCKGAERICNDYSLIRRSGIKGRIAVVLLEWETGY
jgi:L-lactate utilization protein LutB